jgi:hypothetical protein
MCKLIVNKTKQRFKMLRLQQRDIEDFIFTSRDDFFSGKPNTVNREFKMICSAHGDGKWYLVLTCNPDNTEIMLCGQRGGLRNFSTLDAAYNLCFKLGVSMHVVGKAVSCIKGEF